MTTLTIVLAILLGASILTAVEFYKWYREEKSQKEFQIFVTELWKELYESSTNPPKKDDEKTKIEN